MSRAHGQVFLHGIPTGHRTRTFLNLSMTPSTGLRTREYFLTWPELENELKKRGSSTSQRKFTGVGAGEGGSRKSGKSVPWVTGCLAERSSGHTVGVSAACFPHPAGIRDSRLQSPTLQEGSAHITPWKGRQWTLGFPVPILSCLFQKGFSGTGEEILAGENGNLVISG